MELCPLRATLALSITPGYNFNAASGISPWFPGVTFDVPIETAGKRGTRITRAEYLAEAARHNVTNVAWQVRSNLRKALTGLTTAERRRGVLRDQVEVQQRIAELVGSSGAVPAPLRSWRCWRWKPGPVWRPANWRMRYNYPSRPRRWASRSATREAQERS
ncbi:MAG: TolC family protein [Gammaproteobacteria bacterium]